MAVVVREIKFDELKQLLDHYKYLNADERLAITGKHSTVFTVTFVQLKR